MSEQWYPDNDPITGDPLFMVIEHPIKGMVPTYGGPFDSYTLAERDPDESTDDEIHYTRERYDHDEGAWIENVIEGLSVVLVSDDRLTTLKAQHDELLAAANGIKAWWRLPSIARTVDDTIETPMRAIIEAITNAEKDKP